VVVVQLGYVIAYVADVEATIEWWERAFALGRRFVAEDGSYGELDTGATTLSFASHAMGKANLPGGFAPHDPSGPPAAVEIALVTADVPAAHERAVEAGARALAGPEQKPWGQTVSYVRDPNGILIELCTPVA
jgi:lactoylglutathione lyase